MDGVKRYWIDVQACAQPDANAERTSSPALGEFDEEDEALAESPPVGAVLRRLDSVGTAVATMGAAGWSRFSAASAAKEEVSNA